MPKVLITGAVSLLGAGLLKKVPTNYKIFLTYHNNQSPGSKSRSFPLEICNKQQTFQLVSKLNPQIIVHAASASDVDWCEKNQKAAQAINVEGARNMIDAAKKIKAKIVFISSNAVFDGKNPPYNEDSKVNPINFYGKTKAEGEKIVLASGLSPLVLRLITMYGWQPPGARDNPVTWKIKKLKKRETLTMVTDHFINPLYNIAAAEAIWKAIELAKVGIFHIAGADKVSRYQWALLVAEVFGFNKSLVKPISSNKLKNLTLRPDDTTYQTRKMEIELGIRPVSLLEGLVSMHKEKSLKGL
jgi:dTDP-4-dehydrorhamnose reductase